MSIEVLESAVFSKWKNTHKDRRVKGIVNMHIRRMVMGNMGDVKQLEKGLYEKRIFYEPGYRLYYTSRNSTVIFLLCGGDKSTQDKDIELARIMIQEIENEIS